MCWSGSGVRESQQQQQQQQQQQLDHQSVHPCASSTITSAGLLVLEYRNCTHSGAPVFFSSLSAQLTADGVAKPGAADMVKASLKTQFLNCEKALIKALDGYRSSPLPSPPLRMPLPLSLCVGQCLYVLRMHAQVRAKDARWRGTDATDPSGGHMQLARVRRIHGYRSRAP